MKSKKPYRSPQVVSAPILVPMFACSPSDPNCGDPVAPKPNDPRQ